MSFVPEEFLTNFALPLLAGGELHVGAPLDGEALTALAAEVASPGDALVRVESLRLQAAQAAWIGSVDTPLDDEARRILVGLHNVLFLSHPECERFSVRQRRLGELIDFTEWCLTLPPPRDDAQLVRRHTLLQHLGLLARTDVEIRFWVGRRTFRGQEPPERLLRWRELRRVRERRDHPLWLAAPELSGEQQRLLVLLFDGSPLTDLLLVDRPAPAQRWGRLLPYLRRPRLCRAVCYGYLSRGLAQVGPALARRFWTTVAELRALRGEPVGGGESRATKRAVLSMLAQLIQYLYVAHCLQDDVEPAAVEGDDVAAVLWSVLAVAQRQGLLAPPERLGDALVRRRFDQLVGRSWEKLAAAAEPLNASLQEALSIEG